MPLKLRWVGVEERDLVAQARWACYAPAGKDLKRFIEGIATDPWSRSGDYLLAEQDGTAVGTATSIPFRMWLRGAGMACQGVAYVGTAKSARRRGGNEPGIASAVMKEMLRAAREREFIVSALMPFRASYYEHFGYGLVERRVDWTIPLGILPSGECGNWRLATEADRPAMAALWQKLVQAGHCDVERSAARWEHHRAAEEDGMTFVEQASSGGALRASAFVLSEPVGGRTYLRVQEWSADGMESFVRLLRFLGTMRDQFSSAIICVRADVPVNRLLREPQLPHRAVEHAHAEVRSFTRMQLRVLDHARFLQSLRLPEDVAGKVVVAVREAEGEASRFSVDFQGGKCAVKGSAETAQFECNDGTWAAVATGDMAATAAVHNGLATGSAPATTILDVLARGPVPFCREYF